MKYNSEENYCSFSPEKLFGVSFNYACYLHARQYKNDVVNRKSRIEADRFFRREIYKKYTRVNKHLTGLFVAWLYYIGSRMFGERYWLKGSDMREELFGDFPSMFDLAFYI